MTVCILCSIDIVVYLYSDLLVPWLQNQDATKGTKRAKGLLPVILNQQFQPVLNKSMSYLYNKHVLGANDSILGKRQHPLLIQLDQAQEVTGFLQTGFLQN